MLRKDVLRILTDLSENNFQEEINKFKELDINTETFCLELMLEKAVTD